MLPAFPNVIPFHLPLCLPVSLSNPSTAMGATLLTTYTVSATRPICNKLTMSNGRISRLKMLQATKTGI